MVEWDMYEKNLIEFNFQRNIFMTLKEILINNKIL